MLGISNGRYSTIERHPGRVAMEQLNQILRLLGAGLILELNDAPRSGATAAVRNAGEW